MNEIMTVTAGGAARVGRWLVVEAMVINLGDMPAGLTAVRVTDP